LEEGVGKSRKHVAVAGARSPSTDVRNGKIGRAITPGAEQQGQGSPQTDEEAKTMGGIAERISLARLPRGVPSPCGDQASGTRGARQKQASNPRTNLRRSFITYALANGKTETRVADRTGHRSRTMINRYRRVARTVAEARLGDLVPLHLAIPELATANTAANAAANEIGNHPRLILLVVPNTSGR
jgi:hypothetical protein